MAEDKKADPFEILDKAAEMKFPADSLLRQKVEDWFGELSGKEGLKIMSSRSRFLDIIAALVMMVWDLKAQLKRATKNKST